MVVPFAWYFRKCIFIPILQLWGGEVELVVLSRLYNRSIVVYNELSERREVQEQVFLSIQDEENGCTVDKLTNPVSLEQALGTSAVF